MDENQGLCMNFDHFREIVDGCTNEQELSQKWLNEILRKYFDLDLKDVQYERNTIGGRLDCRLIVNDRLYGSG